MNHSNNDVFFRFNTWLLILTALAKLYSTIGTAHVLRIQDQLLHVGYRPLMVFAALVELASAAFLIRSQSDLRRCLVLLWLSANFLFYHWGNYILGVHLCPCLGSLTEKLPLPKGMGETVLRLLVFYWFFASLNLLWRDWGAAQWARLLAAARNGAAMAMVARPKP